VFTWHELLAPLPPDAVVVRRLVAPPGLAEEPGYVAIAGWEQLTVELSAGPAGMRHILVVLDGTGRPISANDHVVTCREVPNALSTGTESVHTSLGGRLEPDGAFNGTRWRMVRVLAADVDDDQEIAPFESERSIPTPNEIARIKALMADVMRRAGERPAT
jgi:hypothetical protein